MPELPEVETVRRQLDTLLEAPIIDAHIATPSFCPGWHPADIIGQHIARTQRVGKHLLLWLGNGGLLASHLRMSGRLHITQPGQLAPGPHRHAYITFADGRILHAVDPRRFGYLRYSADTAALLVALGLPLLGPDAYTAPPTGTQLAARAGSGIRPIKATLLDQHVIAGLGNIYVDEILHAAQLHPDTPTGSITPSQWDAIAAASQCIIAAAVAAGGSTVRTYASSHGTPGTYQHQLAAYGRAGLPCTRCGTPLAATRSAGRGTVFCPVCQCAKGKT